MTCFTDIDDSYAQVVGTVMGRPVTRGTLVVMFDRVKNEEHWKGPIDCVTYITRDLEMEVLREAIIFFTGSVPTFTAMGHFRYRVRAAGYFATIGA